MKVAAIIQARMSSTRLPGKVLTDISGHPMLYHVVERVRYSDEVDEVIIATSESLADSQIVSLADCLKIPVFAGSEDDVLDRFVRTARHVGANQVVRITGDCPLIDPAIINETIRLHLTNQNDYTGNLAKRTLPRGLDVEIVSTNVLHQINEMKLMPYHREHVTAYIYEHPDMFKLQDFMVQGNLCRPDIRLTVDTENDLKLLREIYRRFFMPGSIVDVGNVIEWLDSEPDWKNLNIQDEHEHLERNTGAGIRQLKLTDPEDFLN